MPALLHGGLVVMTALLARELGGDTRAQIAAAIAAAIAPMLLTVGHFLTTVTPEILLWCAITLFVIRLINGGDPRLWLVVGLLVGLGFLDKWTTGFLVIGLAVGLLLVPERTVLRTPWLLAGIAVALVVWAPNLVWQAQHGWPQFEVAEGLRNPGEALFTPPGALLLCGAALILALPGLWWLVRSADASHYRALAIALGVIVLAVVITQGKPYYVGGFTPGPVRCRCGCSGDDVDGLDNRDGRLGSPQRAVGDAAATPRHRGEHPPRQQGSHRDGRVARVRRHGRPRVRATS